MQKRSVLSLATLVLFTALPHVALADPVTSSIASNFNGTSIPAGRSIWFNSIVKYTGPTNAPVTITFDQSTIDFTAGGTTYSLPVPTSTVTLSPFVTTATTTFDAGLNRWVTTTPFGTSGNIYLAGLSFPVAVTIDGGVNPVTWSGRFQSSVGGVTLNWKWAAAVYSTFDANHAALGVKPVDDNNASQYQNSDHAGTPENFKDWVVGGARGGGGSNFTGSYSGTKSVFIDGATPVQASTWGSVKALFR